MKRRPIEEIVMSLLAEHIEDPSVLAFRSYLYRKNLTKREWYLLKKLILEYKLRDDFGQEIAILHQYIKAYD